MEWFNPLYLADREAGTANYSDQVLVPMLHDIVNRYRPSMIWADGTRVTGERAHPAAP